MFFASGAMCQEFLRRVCGGSSDLPDVWFVTYDFDPGSISSVDVCRLVLLLVAFSEEHKDLKLQRLCI